MAELVITPDKNIYELPQNLDIKKAPIAEPTAVSLHAVELGIDMLKKPIDQSKILIIGGGAIGLLCALILEKIQSDLNEMNSKIEGLEKETLEMVEIAKKDAENVKARIVEEGRIEIKRMKEQASFVLKQEQRKSDCC